MNSQELGHPYPAALLITYQVASFVGLLPLLSMTCFGRLYLPIVLGAHYSLYFTLKSFVPQPLREQDVETAT